MENLMDTIVAIMGYVCPFGFLAIWLGAVGLVIRMICSIRIKPGEVIAFHRRGSLQVDGIWDRPGRHWRLPNSRLAWVHLRVDEPVFVNSEPVQAQTAEGATIILTVRLTMDVVPPPTRYVVAAVGKVVERWREETLPILIAQAVSVYSAGQCLNERGQVAQSIEINVAAWFAGNSTPDLGLSLRGATITGATRPPVPRS